MQGTNQFGITLIFCVLCQYSVPYFSELYQANRWHTDTNLWTPMAILNNSEHVFIGDIVEFKYNLIVLYVQQ